MLEDLLRRERAKILKDWFNRIVDTYPEETARFLRREKDPFANPVGSAIREGTEGLFDQLLGDAPVQSLIPFLDRIVRIRAVQDLSPSAAIAFVFLLKDGLRDVLSKEVGKKNLHDEILSLESRIDRVALIAFDTYMKCREEIYELRVREIRGHRDAAIRMMERSGRFFESAPEAEKP